MCKKLFFLMIIAILVSVAATSQAGLDDDPSLIAWWKFDGDATDSSGNEHHGTLMGDPAPVFSDGMIGQALDTTEPGGPGYVEISGFMGILGGNPFSITAWINTSDNEGTLMGWGSTAGGSTRFEFRPWENRLRAESDGNIQGQTTVSDNEWHHVAVTVAENSTAGSPGVTLYLDGEIDSGVDTNNNPLAMAAGNDVTIARRHSGAARWFDALIDDVRLYTRELTPEEIKALATPPRAHAPIPEDGEILSETWVNLKWSASYDAVSHDLYVGTNYDDVNDGTGETFRGNQTNTDVIVGFPTFLYPDGLALGTTYYWRVDEVLADGTKQKGHVWSFFVPPKQAYNPSPADGTKYVQPDVTLSWLSGMKAILHSVYFGDNFDEVNNASGAMPAADTTYTPEALELDKTYYWRVDEFDGAATNKGEVFSFQVKPEIPITDPDLLCWWTLDEAQGEIVLDWSGHGHDTTFTGKPEWVDGVDGSALNFSGDNQSVIFNLPEDVNRPAWTMTVWCKSNVLGQINNSGIASTYQGTTGGFQLSYDPSNNYRYHSSVDHEIGSAKTYWVHLAVSYDGTLATAYYNGEFAGTFTPAAEDLAHNKFAIGANRANDNWFDGSVDEFRFYTRALTQDEVQLVMRIDPLLAWNPHPMNGMTLDIDTAIPLSWSQGDRALSHEVYFGLDKDAVASADTSDTTGIYRGSLNETSFTPAEGVEWGGGPYYWRVDENNIDGTVTKGSMWSFTVDDFILIDDFEDYDTGENQIWYAWHDGLGYGTPDFPPYFAGNGTGSAVGDENTASYTEETIVNGGFQSMPLFYDNNKLNFAKYSEAELTLTAPRNWSRHGIEVLSLWFRGHLESSSSITGDPSGTFTMATRSGDIFGQSDQLFYLFKQLSGVGSITAKIESVTNTSPSAKVGVMIRETLTADSKHAFTFIRPDNGIRFNRRTEVGDTTTNSVENGLAFPRWIKLERSISGLFTASHSADGINWVPVDDQNFGSSATIMMGNNVYIGLALSSNNTEEICEAVISDIQVTGTIIGEWQSQDIGILANDPEPMYIALSNSTGDPAVVYHDDPIATIIGVWTEWQIPLQLFADQGIDLTDVNSIRIGLGTQGNMTIPGGSGKMYYDDIKLYRLQLEPEAQP